MQFSVEERTFILEIYLKSKSYKVTKEEFAKKCTSRNPPTNRTIRLLYNKFKETGSVKSKLRVRTRPTLNTELLTGIQNDLNQNPNLSKRRIAANKNISLGSAHMGVRKILKLHPYKVQVFYELISTDFPKRINYCQWLLNAINDNPSILDNMFFSDEAWFQLNGYVNSQNYRFWSSSNPHQYIEAPLHSAKTGVWCAMSRKKIIGPIFFSGRLNFEAYINIIMEFIGNLEVEDRYCWFQQDGASCHTSAMTIATLQDFFGDRLITKGLWPPRSPDLSSLDFFLWGFLKDKVYLNKPQTLQELQSNIKREIGYINRDILERVSINMIKRLNICLRENGNHFQQFL